MNLPIAERELRVAARAPRTYRMRMMAAVVFGLITAWMLWAMGRIATASMVAPQVYAMIAFAATLSCMFSINATGDSISSEKRAGTLGLLFLTDLKGRDVIFGKLAAMGMASFYGLMATIPMISLPVLIGGISGESQLKTAISLMNTLFFSLSMGLWVSSRSWDQKRAMNACVWIALIFVWGLPGLAAILVQRYHLIELAGVLVIFSPMYQQQHANPFGVGMMRDHYWLSLGCVHGLAWLALWRACRVLPTAWQDRPVGAEKGRWKAKWNAFKYGSEEKRLVFRKRLLDLNPVHWLGSVEMRAPWWMWFFVGMVLVGWASMWAWLKYAIKEEVPVWGVGIPATLILQMGIWMRASAIASEIIARDRFSGALELLLSTSLTVPEVARGQALTVRRNILWPALFTALVSVAVFKMGYPEAVKPDDRAACWMALVGLNVLFITQLCGAFWTGMWGACITRLPNGAVGQVMLRCLVFPIMIFLATLTATALLKKDVTGGFIPWFTIWFSICFTNAIAWGVYSCHRFHEKLRVVAAERYQPAKDDDAWWKFWRWFEPARS